MTDDGIPYKIGRMEVRIAELHDRLDRQAGWQTEREERFDRLWDLQEQRHLAAIQKLETNMLQKVDALAALVSPLVQQHSHMTIGVRVLRVIGWGALGLYLLFKGGGAADLKDWLRP